MARNRTARSRVLSLRSALIMGAVGVLTVGMAQIGGTQAASTDTATAESGQFAAVRNFWPTPVVPENFIKDGTTQKIAVPCQSGGTTPSRASISWAAPAGIPITGYRVVRVRYDVALDKTWQQLKDDGDIQYQWSDRGPSTTSVGGIINGPVNGVDSKSWIRVFTVNGPKVSTGWAGASVERSGGGDKNPTVCSGDYHTQPNKFKWESEYNRLDNEVGGFGMTTFGLRTVGPDVEALESTTEDAPSTSEESTTTTTSAEESSSSAKPTASSSSKTPSGTPSSTPPKTPSGTSPTTPSGTPSSAPSDIPTTTPPVLEKPELTGKATGGPAGVTAGTSTNGKKAILVDGKGNLLVDGAIEQGSTLKWLDGELWIIGESQVSRISVASDGKWKFYENGGPLPESLSSD